MEPCLLRGVEVILLGGSCVGRGGVKMFAEGEGMALFVWVGWVVDWMEISLCLSGCGGYGLRAEGCVSKNDRVCAQCIDLRRYGREAGLL